MDAAKIKVGPAFFKGWTRFLPPTEASSPTRALQQNGGGLTHGGDFKKCQKFPRTQDFSGTNEGGHEWQPVLAVMAMHTRLPSSDERSLFLAATAGRTLQWWRAECQYFAIPQACASRGNRKTQKPSNGITLDTIHCLSSPFSPFKSM